MDRYLHRKYQIPIEAECLNTCRHREVASNGKLGSALTTELQYHYKKARVLWRIFSPTLAYFQRLLQDQLWSFCIAFLKHQKPMLYLHLGHQLENPERKCHVRSDFEWNFEGCIRRGRNSGVVTQYCRPNRIACRIQNSRGNQQR